MKTRTRIALAVLSGILEPLGFAGFGLFPLTWIAKVPVLLAVRDLAPRQAFRYGMLYGLIAYFGGYHWLAHTFSTFGGLSPVLAWIGTMLVCSYLGLLFGFLITLVSQLKLPPVWSLAFVNPALELLFPNIFPYNIGASQHRFTAITQIVEVTGMLGLTALIGLVNGACFELLESRLDHRKLIKTRVLVPALVFAFTLAFSLVRLSQIDAQKHPQLTVGLVQTNLDAAQKLRNMASLRADHHAMSHALVAAHPEVQLIIWPETVIKAPPQLPRPFIVGAMLHDDQNHLFNAALSHESRYDKRSLLPFGEMIPFEGTFPSLRRLFPFTGRYTAGASLHHLKAAGITFLPTLCYEDIQPARVREIWTQSGPAEALVNLSDDSWFGDTHEPSIHLALATFRAIETRRALIRSTNTGISALVDPAGRILAQTGQHTRETLVGRIPIIRDGSTALYMRFGDWFGWLCVLLTLSTFVSLRGRRFRC